MKVAAPKSPPVPKTSAQGPGVSAGPKKALLALSPNIRDYGFSEPSNDEVLARVLGLETAGRNQVRPSDDQVEKEITKHFGLKQMYSDDFVRISSNVKLTQAECVALAKKVKDAYGYDEKQLGWKDTSPLAKPLDVAALSPAAFAELLGPGAEGVGGVTVSRNLFLVPSTEITKKATPATHAFNDEVVAHELGHVQDGREGGKAEDPVPIYIEEGRQYIDGEKYPATLGESNPHTEYVARILAQCTEDDATQVFKYYRKSADEQSTKVNGFIGETLGSLYVEYLRTHLGGKGVPDAMARLSDVIVSVGKGTPYSTAFKEKFGVTPAESESQFIDFMRKTDGKPLARFQGTYLEAAAKAAGKKLLEPLPGMDGANQDDGSDGSVIVIPLSSLSPGADGDDPFGALFPRSGGRSDDPFDSLGWTPVEARKS